MKIEEIKKLSELNEVVTLYYTKYDIPMRVTGKIRKKIRTDKEGRQYQELRGYRSIYLCTWENLSNTQKGKLIKDEYHTELSGINFEVAKDPTLSCNAKNWRIDAKNRKDYCLEHLVPYRVTSSL